MDRDAFFRGATLAICSSLQIETAMSRCVGALRDRIPVDRMFLQIYESDLGAMRTIAEADAEKGRVLDALTPMPRETRELIREHLDRFREGFVTISSPERNPVTREMLRFHGLEGWSVLHMTLMTENQRIGAVVLSAKGTDCYGEEHVELLGLLRRPFTSALFNTLEHREVLRLRDRLSDDNSFLNRELIRISGDEIVGADFGLKNVMDLVHQVAVSDSPVLLTGETGVGKDVIAGVIHAESSRRNRPFIAVNCGAIPDSLVDSELFGHEKGAFTGALSRKRGRFERAHQGSIFLDEIGEMPLSAQIRMLRVIQNREIERVGGVERIPLDIRIIAATNRDLSSLMMDGRFREDLWYRLNVFPIAVPPLRDRRSDIPALVEHFIRQKTRELKLQLEPTLAPGAIETLTAYPWPGNVRELANAVERSIILNPAGPLRFDLVSPPGGESAPAPQAPGDQTFPSLRQVEEAHIRRALVLSGGKIHGSGGAGDLLAINPNTLRHRMKKLRIPFGRPSS